MVPYGIVELHQCRHRMDGKMTVSGICFKILYGGGREEDGATDETNWSESLAMEMDLMEVNIPFALLLCMFEIYCNKKVPRISSETYSTLSHFHFSAVITAFFHLPPLHLDPRDDRARPDEEG